MVDKIGKISNDLRNSNDLVKKEFDKVLQQKTDELVKQNADLTREIEEKFDTKLAQKQDSAASEKRFTQLKEATFPREAGDALATSLDDVKIIVEKKQDTVRADKDLRDIQQQLAEKMNAANEEILKNDIQKEIEKQVRDINQKLAGIDKGQKTDQASLEDLQK